MVSTNMDVLLTKKDMEEFVLIFKGENLDQVEQECAFLADLIRDEVESKAPYTLLTSAGTPQQRLGDLHRSFAEALGKIKSTREELETNALRKIDHSALRHFLENGEETGFDAFFEQTIKPLGESALRDGLLKRYVMIDMVLAAAQFVSDLGGDASLIIPTIYDNDSLLANLETLDQVKEETEKIFTAAIVFRDSQANKDRATIVQHTKAYIANHYPNSALSLNEVAAQANFSPNHFSAIFSEETGGTFRDYLTHTRLEQAKKLLRTTHSKISEIAILCGYNDPHYFSMIFHKNCGMTPKRYRAASQK